MDDHGGVDFEQYGERKTATKPSQKSVMDSLTSTPRGY